MASAILVIFNNLIRCFEYPPELDQSTLTLGISPLVNNSFSGDNSFNRTCIDRLKPGEALQGSEDNGWLLQIILCFTHRMFFE